MTNNEIKNSKDAKDEIIDLMKKYSKNKDDATRNALIDKLKEYSCKNTDKNDDEYKFCWCTLSSYCGYCISRNGNIVIIETAKPIQCIAGTKVIFQDSQFKFNDNNNEIINYKKLDTKNGYIINPDGSDSPYIKIGDRELKLSTNVDVYKFMAGAGWLENIPEDKSYKKEIENSFKDECLEIHHINNNPNDNRDVNLVYLPRSIHAFAHKYEIDKKNYNLKLTEDEYKKVNAFIEHVLRG